MNNIFIARRLNKLNDDLSNILKLYNTEEMSGTAHSSKIPRKPCSCVHHKSPIADDKSRPRCCNCKKRYRTHTKSTEKCPQTPDESTHQSPRAGEPHVDDPGGPEDAPSSRKIELDELQRELADEKGKVEELERNLQKLQSETETLKSSKDVVLAQMSALQEQIEQFTLENQSLKCECKCLKDKLKVVEDREERRTSEISDEFQKMQNVIKEKDDTLINEKNQLTKVISESLNTVKEQQKKIADLTTVCKRQKTKIDENDKILSSKTMQLSDTERKLKAKCCECKDLQEEIDNIKRCLNDESKAANDFKKELDTCKDDCRCELLIKDKIIEDQNETIKRLKNLLHDSEKNAQQVIREHEMLTDELYSERQQNNELKMRLEEFEETFEYQKLQKCQQCKVLEGKLHCLIEQKEKALLAAKYAAKKLYETTKEYQTQLSTEKQQYRFLMTVLKQKDDEIVCLKKEIVHMRLHN